MLGSRATIVKVIVRDFTIAAESQLARALAGQREDSRIDLGGLNNFNDSVALSIAAFPSASNVTLFPATVTVRPGQTSTASLSFNSSAAGIYTLTITGQSEGSSHSANVTLIVQDFKISVSLPDSPVLANSNRTLTLFVSGIEGFSGNVTLAAGISPHGLTVELTPRVVFLTPGETRDASLIMYVPSSAPIGSYNITVDATGSGIHHQTVLTLNVSHPTSGSQTQSTILGLQLVQFVVLVSSVMATGAIIAYEKLILNRKHRGQLV
jgi:hypothetical protein